MEIQDSLFQATRLQPDSIALKHAQPDQIKTIAYLLAQTVALHFYEMYVLHAARAAALLAPAP